MGLLDLFHDAECLIWKSNPIFWQAVLAINEAKANGQLKSQAACEQAVAKGDDIFADLQGMVGSCGNCACEFVFSSPDQKAADQVISAIKTTGIHIFVRGKDNAAWHKWWDHQKWLGWENRGGDLSTGIGAASPEGGQPHIFALDGHQQLTNSWWNGKQWSAWEELGAPNPGLSNDAPAVTCPVPGQVHVFVRGKDNAAWHKWWDGQKWLGWENLGGELSTGIGAASPEGGQPHIFALDGHQQLINSWWNGKQWSAWGGLGAPNPGLANDAPAVTCPVPGQVHVFVRGKDNAAWHKWWDGQKWSGWENLGGELSTGIGAATLVPGQPHIFGLDPVHNQLIHAWWNGKQWSAWENLGSPDPGLASEPGVTAA